MSHKDSGPQSTHAKPSWLLLDPADPSISSPYNLSLHVFYTDDDDDDDSLLHWEITYNLFYSMTYSFSQDLV